MGGRTDLGGHGRWRRGLLISATALLVLGGCQSPPTQGALDTAGFSARETKQLFQSGYRRIYSSYVDPVDLALLTADGLKGLKSLDDRLDVVRDANSLTLRRAGEAVYVATLPKPDDIEGWSNVTSNGIEAARRASPALQQTEAERLTAVVFSALLADLDPYSRYLPPSEARRAREGREGFGGVGISLDAQDPRRVATVNRDGPAEAADIHVGDVILSIDGKATEGMTVEAMVGLLRGDVNSTVDLTIRRGIGDAFQRRITRAQIYVPTVAAQRLADDIAYFQVTGFNVNTTASLRRGFNRIAQERKTPLKGMILDLRGNPGGILNQGRDVADLFMDHGPIFGQRDRRGLVDDAGSRPVAHADDDLGRGLPMVVLVDGRSASSAEVVAAALQDSGRALVIGSSSFGKGTVQTIYSLPNGGDLNLTTRRLVTPAGNTLHQLGVFPNVCTASASEDSAGVQGLVASLKAGTIDIQAPQRQRREADALPTADKLKARDACPPLTAARKVDIERDIAQALLKDHALATRLQPRPTVVAGF